MDKVTVIKQNIEGKETWRYEGTILQQRDKAILLEARFNRKDLPFHDVVFRENDRFVEAYYTDCWYNIFEIHDKDDDRLKCWYCNVTYPAEFKDGVISYIDLALDLLVYPDGTQLVLDEDEFTALEVDPVTRTRARSALQELKALFKPPVGVLLDSFARGDKKEVE